MFDSLSARFQDVFASLRGEVRLTPQLVETALKQIRLALLEADVNFKVVKAFIDRVRDRAIDRSVLDSLTPAQQVVGIVRDELLALFGDVPDGFARTDQRPQVVLLVGLQGSGKTTTTAKLGRWLTAEGRHPLLVSTDVRRPAAIAQLNVLAEQAALRVHDPPGDLDPVRRARSAVSAARELGFDVVLVDSAGRLHIDDDLMTELRGVKEAVAPSDVLYVADAMTGQDAIKSAGEFHHRMTLTGVTLTKLDGDARGGAALSVVSVVGVPIVFAGMGEGLDDLEPFRPDRLVSRMLGMGDVLTLVEKAEQVVSQERAAVLAERIQRDSFTLDDLKEQLAAVKKMGPLEQLTDLVPGFQQVRGAGGAAPEMDPRQLGRTTAIIDSMTQAERRTPAIINGSRRARIARGSGTKVEEINRLLKQFAQMRKMLKGVAAAGRKGKKRRGGGRLGLLGRRSLAR